MLFQHIPLYREPWGVGRLYFPKNAFTVLTRKAFETEIDAFDNFYWPFAALLGQLLLEAIIDDRLTIAECLLDHGAAVTQSTIELALSKVLDTGNDRLLAPLLRNFIFTNRYHWLELDLPRLRNLVFDTPLAKYLELFIAAYHAFTSKRELVVEVMIQKRLQDAAHALVPECPTLQKEISE